mgnify:CR=1 FL=1
MKLLKKIAAIMLSIMMVLGMASVVSADTTSGTSAATRGKITINNATVGQTYKIYQILELESFSGKPSSGTNTGNYAYKVATGWSEFITTGEGNTYLEITDGYVKWKGATDAASVAEFAKKALAYATSKNLIATKTADKVAATTVEFTDLALGYYLVESSVGALCGLTTTDNEVTIQEKNGAPSVKKEVQEDSTSAWGDSNTADIGQTVNFQTTITAQLGAQNYVLHDKMDKGLTFDGTVTVKKNGADVAETNYTLKKSTDSPASITDDCTFEIAFTKDFCDTLKANDQIIITYSATLNENAVIAGEGNKNTTKLTYGDSSETTPSTTTTKTFELPVFKYTMKNSTETALADATFTLSKNDDGTNPIKLVKDITTGGIYRVAKTNETGTVTSVTTPTSGKFTIKGLDADTYYLTETQQPAGYNKLSAPIKVVIAEDGSITVNDQTPSVTEVKVENNTGSILPSTGGSGTTLIYILGAVLVLGSSVVLITKKRMR